MTILPTPDSASPPANRRIAFYGGSFDPPHAGHFAVAAALVEQFSLDQFVFVPAFHAPHKAGRKPASAYHRFAMLAIETAGRPKMLVSALELQMPERPYTVETLARLNDVYKNSDIFFVMGADSWTDIKTWRAWETVLTMTNHIVVTRPGFSLSFDVAGESIGKRIVDLRGGKPAVGTDQSGPRIFFTDAVTMDVSAMKIRADIRRGDKKWHADVPQAVANYIEKYELYK